MATTSYYAFRHDDDTLTGLVRRSGSPTAFHTLERVSPPPSEWVDDPELIRHFADPGDSKLEEIDVAQAKTLADRYGVEL
jgi:hypothetical protein